MTKQTSGIDKLAFIVEDDTKLGVIFARALQTAGFETEIIEDGNVALTRLKEEIPALVILDLHLPFVSGEDILRQVRADDRLTGTRVILATADPQIAQRLQDDADLVLIKPVSFRQLRDLATRIVQ